MLAFLFALLTVCACLGVGDLCLRKLKLEYSLSFRLTYSCATGLGIFAYSILGIGLASQLQHLWLLGISFAAIGIYGWIELIPLIKEQIKTRLEVNLCSSLFLLAMAIFAIIILIQAYTPADSLEWDSIAYHLAFPKLYLLHHKIYYINFIHHSNFPSTTEMLYTWALAFPIAGQSSAKLIHATFTLIALSGCGIFAQINGGIAARRTAVLLTAFSPIVLWESGTAYVDMATCAFTCLSLFAAYHCCNEKKANWAVVAGIMAGFAVGTKSTALVSAGIIALLILLFSGESLGVKLKRSLTMFGIVILIASPWFVKTYVYTGNPVYPFFYSILGGRNWSTENAFQYTKEQQSFGAGSDVHQRHSLSSFFSLPWNLSSYVKQPSDAPLSTYGFTNAGTPFALLGAIPFAFILAMPWLRLPKETKLFMFYNLGFVLVWFFLSQQSRYLIALIPINAVLFGITAANEKRRIKYLLYTALAAHCFATLYVFVTFGMQRSLARVIGGLSDTEYLQKFETSLWEASQFINTLPANSKTMLIDDVRGFYFDRDYVWGNPGHHTLIPYSSFQSASEQVKFLKRARYTHVLLNSQWGPGFSGEPWRERFNSAVNQSILKTIYSNKGISIFEISNK